MSTHSVDRRFAPAKVNLGLHVLRRRADGFHDIETVLLPIPWHDDLRVEPGQPFSFACSDPTLPTDGRNLCVRAARRLAAWAGIEPLGSLHLEKRIPHGAGLGGGSSDAAHTLRLLADWWDLAPPPKVMQDLATALGSDVPFFLHDAPMLATGRGEQLRSLNYVMPYALAVVMPPVRIATAEAYRLVLPSDRVRPDLALVVQSNDLERWRRELVNDFELPILDGYPVIRQAKSLLLDEGAGYAALSGSGAAVFGAFEQAESARHAAERAAQRGWQSWHMPAYDSGET